MTDPLRVILEIGKQPRRIVAGAMDWPGLERWGKDEDEAAATLEAYVPRYADAAARAGLGDEFGSVRGVEIVERVAGSSSTDWWGIAHVPSEIEREVLSGRAFERRMDLLVATWSYFDDVAERVSADLRLGPRGGGRSRDEIVRHVYASERHNFWRKVGLRAEDGIRLTADELAAYRADYIDRIRSYNADGKPARSYPIQFLIRRTAQHVMDHAWEMEDRDLTSAG